MTSPHGTDPLGLTTILPGSLPLTLFTADAPEQYVVEAVFNRRVEPEEVALLLGASTQEFLDRSGYPNVRLTVSDRRLVIAGTNLEELRDGLAEVIARLLAEVSMQVRDVHEHERAARDREAVSLRERTQAIADLIETIDFRPYTG